MTPFSKKCDPDDKTYYQPISVLSSLSKVYEKIYKELNLFFETKLSPYLCRFRPSYSTQHALSNLLFNWQSCLDKSVVVGAIFIGLFKAFERITHDLIIGKLHLWCTLCFLRLVRNYLSSRHQKTKLD